MQIVLIKFNLYVKIILMKRHMNLNFKLISSCLLSLLLVVLIAFGFFAFNDKGKVNATNTAKSELFLPANELEYRALTSPTGIYHDGKVTAIIENNTNPSLSVSIDGITKSLTFTQLTSVNLLNDNTLLFTTEARLKKIDLSNFKTESLTSASLCEEFDNKAVSNFDLNSNYIVTTHEELTVFAIDGSSITELPDELDVYSRSHVAINDNNQIFYVNADSELCMIYADNVGGNSKILAQINPTTITADNDYVYYVFNNKIFRIPVDGGSPELLTASDPDYDLGNVITPAGISLYNGNLLIADTGLNAVQEFAINGNVLEFTGFAIAKNKTAYNRVTSNAIDVEKYGDTVAVLDDYKLSVINTKTLNVYDRSNFKNYLKTQGVGIDASGIALGNDKVLIFNGSTSYSILNLSSGSFTPLTLPEQHVYDACYQSGKFYVYAYTNSDSRVVYSIDENDADYTAVKVFEDDVDAKIINVDVFGNVYLASDTTVHLYEKANGYEEKIIKDDRVGVKKMLTDLGGTLYLLDNQGVSVLNSGEFNGITLSSPFASAVTSFALDFVTSSVYFVYGGEETVCTSNDMGNLSLSNAIPTAEYVTSDNTADIETLKVYKPKDGTNVYSVKKADKSFYFEKLVRDRNEYVYICPITLDNGISSVTLYALAGQTETVLVNSLDLESVQLDVKDSTTDTAYTATGVNVYYIPIMTKNSEYSLSDNSTMVRLNSGAKFTPEKVLNYLGNEFYYATVEVNGTTYKGYIPTAFTTVNLAQNFELENFTYEKVKATTLYSDFELSTEIATLKSGTKVKLYAINDGVATVSVEIDGEWTVGYINAKDIKNEPSRAVRNALIIIAVAACLSATTAYFILKKND